MIKVQIGNIFDSKAQTLVNTVNCVGVMGKGIALDFKKHFPDMYKDYFAKCSRGEVKLGEPYLYKASIFPWILNFPTKDHWRSLARLDDITAGLDHLTKNYQEWGITSLAVPPLGSGLGQLEWRIVGPVLYQHLSKMEIDIELYAPYGTPADELQLTFLTSEDSSGQFALRPPNFEWISPSWFALVEILGRVEKQPYHPPVGRTSFQKMAYVAKSIGLPLDVDFIKGSFGPFSSNLNQKISRLVNNKLIKEKPYGRMIRIMVDSSYEKMKQYYLPEIHEWDELIEKVCDLFMRVDTKEAEIIATVIFSANELRTQGEVRPTENQVLQAVLEWKELRFNQIDKTRVAYTVRNLAAHGWLDVRASPDLPIRSELAA